MLGQSNAVPSGPGRVFSVWDWTGMHYNYFHSAGTRGDQANWLVKPPPSTRPVVHAALGDPIENLLRLLPTDAVKIGSGRRAVGEIAATPDMLRIRTPPGLGDTGADVKRGAAFAWAAVLIGAVGIVKWATSD